MKTTIPRPTPLDRTGPAAPADHRAPPITPAALLREVRDVVADVPLLLVAPLLRHWHRTWGATAEEAAATMPGDGLLPRAQYRCTRAITVAAPPGEVWPWLVQVGFGRAGWYANDLLDNFARPSARTIVPGLQDLHLGQRLAFVPWPSERTAFVVEDFVVPEWLLWRTPNRTWAWRLRPLPGGRTRLVTRMHTVYEWSRPFVLLTVLLAEVGDFPMMRRMLRGIRARAEAAHGPQHRRPPGGPA
ncbi:hypothetical protein ACI782_22165 [Geodermatophilus sp. SYSU D00703]